eukprot:UN01454
MGWKKKKMMMINNKNGKIFIAYLTDVETCQNVYRITIELSSTTTTTNLPKVSFIKIPSCNNDGMLGFLSQQLGTFLHKQRQYDVEFWSKHGLSHIDPSKIDLTIDRKFLWGDAIQYSAANYYRQLELRIWEDEDDEIYPTTEKQIQQYLLQSNWEQSYNKPALRRIQYLLQLHAQKRYKKYGCPKIPLSHTPPKAEWLYRYYLSMHQCPIDYPYPPAEFMALHTTFGFCDKECPGVMGLLSINDNSNLNDNNNNNNTNQEYYCFILFTSIYQYFIFSCKLYGP